MFMDHCALVRSLGHTITAHEPGTTYMATGNRPSPALDYPPLGSLAARVLPEYPCKKGSGKAPTTTGTWIACFHAR